MFLTYILFLISHSNKKESTQSIDEYIFSTEVRLHSSQNTPLKRTFVSSKGQTLKLVNSDDETSDDCDSLEEQRTSDNKINSVSESLVDDTRADKEEGKSLNIKAAFNDNIIDNDEVQTPENYFASPEEQEEENLTQGKGLLMRPKINSITFILYMLYYISIFISHKSNSYFGMTILFLI